MNNAVFGKTMENVRNHVDVKLLTKWDGRYGAETMIAKPNFHSRSIFAENLIAVELRKLEVKFNKPIYVGMCILDISKVCLYEFHHEYMLPLFRDKCKIMYTDTDSLVYSFECEDVYETTRGTTYILSLGNTECRQVPSDVFITKFDIFDHNLLQNVLLFERDLYCLQLLENCVSAKKWN